MAFADWLLLTLATFGAALVQSATGFGFSILAVPVFLLALHAVEAVQINIIVTILIALSILPTIWREADKTFMRRFVVGNLPGLPAGLLIYAFASLFVIKLLVAAVILLFAGLILHSRKRARRRETPEAKRPPAVADYACGFGAGVLAPSLGMPGVAVLMYFADSPLHEKTIRGTALTSVIFAYVASLVLQILVLGIDSRTLVIAAGITPFAILGGHLGMVLGRWVDKRRFQMFAVALLFATGG
ncbi:MAG: sulfite exporter TauE/SafE family protein, partial [Alphaproteobacteria bacterium]|nr:sulfite exporter TauE/SafE family protein [Alphaproteobacteria bacterium]